MPRAEVRARFDEIVAFAEIEPFIDTPVKRYSSGMYARLGFAVAAHLRPSILIVDEVLAVGDLPFQAKCLARMHQLTGDGITVLFVSHNLLAVADLCERALVLADGRLAFDGGTSDAIRVYRRTIADRPSANGSANQAVGIAVNGQPAGDSFDLRAKERLEVDATVDRRPDAQDLDVVLNLVIESPDGRPVVHLRSDLTGDHLSLRGGRNVLRVTVEDLPLAPGSYWLWLRLVGLSEHEPLLLDSERVELDVSGDAGTGAVIAPVHRFEQAGDARSTVPAGISR
jgi:lipopolysaccharide transport system ATP-binding protein